MAFNEIKKWEVIQLNIGALVGGYSSSVGVPISIGALPARKKRLVEFGLEAHLKTMELIKGGKAAAEVVTDYEAWVKQQGFEKYMLYGPCHGIGMMEVERPWMESTSTYDLQPNMTFQVDTFFYDEDFGLRWENGVRVTETGSLQKTVTLHFTLNQDSFTLGAPFCIPDHYNTSKTKTFFFYSQEWAKYRQGSVSESLPPTVLMRQGNFNFWQIYRQ